MNGNIVVKRDCKVVCCAFDAPSSIGSIDGRIVRVRLLIDARILSLWRLGSTVDQIDQRRPHHEEAKIDDKKQV